MEFGASTLRHAELSKELFKEYLDNDVKFMEISPVYNSKGTDYAESIFDKINIDEVKSLAQGHNVTINSFHLPFLSQKIDISAFDETVRRKTVELNKKIIEKTAKLGNLFIVCHPSGERLEGEQRKIATENSKNSISELAKTAKDFGATLAIEDLPRLCLGNTAKDIKELISVDSSVKVCFDVNHLLIDTHKNFFETLGKNIVTLHISDYDFVDERHWAPGKGKIDWNEITQNLKKIEFKGPFMNEVPFFLNQTDKLSLKELKAANMKILQG